MSKKNGATPPVEGTAAAVREASRSSVSPGAEPPAERPVRRRFSATYKLSILRQADEAAAGGEGAIGALLRREGLYSSHLTSWRKQRERGALAGLSPKKRGRKPTPKSPLADEVEMLRRENARLESELDKASAGVRNASPLW